MPLMGHEVSLPGGTEAAAPGNTFAELPQLVEGLIRNQDARGSSPRIGTIGGKSSW